MFGTPLSCTSKVNSFTFDVRAWLVLRWRKWGVCITHLESKN